MILSAFTLFHVLLSLIGIAAGFTVFYELLLSKRFPAGAWTTVFLYTTLATSVTGFLFPFREFLPSHGVGVLSILVLVLAFAARRKYRAEGGWGTPGIIASLTALYLNVFVLVAQIFLKIPFFHDLAPTQTEPPFAIAQLAVLCGFAAFGVVSVAGYRRQHVSAAAVRRP